MHRRKFVLTTIMSLTLLLVASACGGLEISRSDLSVDSTSDRLQARAQQAIDQIGSLTETDVSISFTDTITLRQLQDAGINVGSYQIDCDQPLDMVVLDGVFDRDDLFRSGVTLAGGSMEAYAMELVAQIYDPETDMPLGMIGDATGNHLSGLSGGASAAGSGISGSMMLETGNSTTSGDLVPEAVCQ